jgi:preprotein translocase subunit SecD
MIRNTRWKVALVIAATLFGILFTAPNFMPAEMRDKLPGWFPHKTLNLGLDLQGGSRLVYQVDTQSLIRERLNNQAEDIRRTLNEQGVQFSDLAVRGNAVELQVSSPAQMDAVAAQLDKLRGSVRLAAGGAIAEFNVERVPPTTLRMTIQQQAVSAEIANGAEQAIQVIEKRVNLLGTKEPSIARQGVDRIVIEAPGESDPEKLKNVIGKTAKLSFQLVDDSASIEEAKAGHVPPGSELLPQPSNPAEPYLVVRKQTLVTGDMLTNAMFAFNPQTNQPIVDFRLNGVGAARFATVTTDNLGKRFAIILDNKVIEAPRIQSPITGGQGMIEGNFTPQSASELALLLNSGALPVQLNVIEQSSVGAGLGQQAIQAGEISLAVGAVCIFAFIILAYGLFGVFAAIALIVNVLLILALMSTTQATLTLPGVAGVILTLAVAVDANVLVYERMRDEARANVAAMLAADHGYRRALVSIIDANITTLIAAAIMFQFGSGPVKGFAWTLAIGVLTSVFTALLITQVLIGWWFKAAKPKQLPI